MAQRLPEFDGLTKGEANAFFLMARYLGAERRYATVRKYKPRFVEEGLLTEEGAKPEPDPAGVTAALGQRSQDHRARFSDKGWALYVKMNRMVLAPVQAAYDEIEARRG